MCYFRDGCKYLQQCHSVSPGINQNNLNSLRAYYCRKFFSMPNLNLSGSLFACLPFYPGLTHSLWSVLSFLRAYVWQIVYNPIFCTRPEDNFRIPHKLSSYFILALKVMNQKAKLTHAHVPIIQHCGIRRGKYLTEKQNHKINNIIELSLFVDLLKRFA